MFSAEIILDSANPYSIDKRITTFLVTMPRYLLPEFNTHHAIAKNSASSRAIPLAKRIQEAEETPYVPGSWGTAQKGMQSGEPVSDESAIEDCRQAWLDARDQAVRSAKELMRRGIHKQIANRLLEPFIWHTVLATATDWTNFFNLRVHPKAAPDMQQVAGLMLEEYWKSEPTVREHHIPFYSNEDAAEDLPDHILKMRCAARCARLSYLTHQGEKSLDADLNLAQLLLSQGHMSPFEHIAEAMAAPGRSGPFDGWSQFRKTIPYEWDVLGQGKIVAP